VDDASCSEFSLTELKKAIGQMKAKGAAGPDNIPPSFLKALGGRGLTELLAIFIESFIRAECGQIWRNATIIPLHKVGKPASDLASFRPVSLTSCVAKTLERMVANRLYHLLESRGLLSCDQAGFRKHHSCEDQVLRITQAISDGFQVNPSLRTVLALLDYSKAYDRVWREELVLMMADMGIPAGITRWVWSFLQNRQANVSFNNTECRRRPIRQGLPQGSVLAPLLFLIYIDSVSKVIPAGVNLAMYADDVSLWSAERSKEAATEKVQEAVLAVARWSREKKMLINTEKSEIAFFTASSREAS
jgi:hypothetical protein